MLAFHDSIHRYGRREFLRVGTLGLAGLSLSDLLAAREVSGTSGVSLLKGKSIIFLFLQGGPSQAETFDPKMTAPAGIRSATGEIATALPGITFATSFPKLAKLADRLAVVRSFVPGDENHDIKPIVGRHTEGANLGSIYARVVGPSHPRSGMPSNVNLYPQAVDSSTLPAELAFGNFAATGPLGAGYAPLVPGGGGAFLDDLKVKLPLERLTDRRELLNQLDHFHRQSDDRGDWIAADSMRRQAFEAILGGVADAFNLSKEDPKVIERYDTSRLVIADQISKQWNNHRLYADNAKSLGKLLLLARRLCERGCGFVTVTTNFVWDMHADENNAGVVEGLGYMGPPLDHALATFITDLEERGLSDKILLVACGEMGRTPRINNRGGRDHWGRLGPLILAGGGLPMGQVIGESSQDAGEPARNPVSISNVVATIMHTLFDVGQVRLLRGLPTEAVRVITSGEPIPELA